MIKGLCFGEILFDVIDQNEHLGGAPLNLAAHLAQCGAQVDMISAIGKDSKGQTAIAAIQSVGVGTKYVIQDSIHPTGIVNVTLKNGQPFYMICEDVAYDYISLTEKEIQKICDTQYDIFCFGTLAQRNKNSRQTLYTLLDRMDGIDVFFDVNLRQHFYSRQILEDSLKYTTILKLNDDEALFLSKYLFDSDFCNRDFAAAVCDRYNIQTVLVTLGEKGSGVFYNGHYEECFGEKVEVADTVGAGDAFSAAFIYERYSGKDPLEATRVANRIGAYVASCNGAIPKYTEKVRSILKGIKA